MMRLALVVAVFSLCAGILTAEPAPTTAPATQARPSVEPLRIKIVITLQADGKTPVYSIDEKDTSLDQLTPVLRSLRKRQADDAKIQSEIRMPAALPYKHLAGVLISCAQADLPTFRLTTDGKDFCDFSMPMIDNNPNLKSQIRRKVLLHTANGKLVATYDAEVLKSSEQLTKSLDESKDRGNLQVIISPDGDTPAQDVLSYAAAAAAAKVRVAFAPAR